VAPARGETTLPCLDRFWTWRLPRWEADAAWTFVRTS